MQKSSDNRISWLTNCLRAEAYSSNSFSFGVIGVSTLFTNYLKVVFRNLLRCKGNYFLNISDLAFWHSHMFADFSICVR